MKKIIFILTICTLAVTQTSAQTTFVKGDNVVNLGVGFGGNLSRSYGWTNEGVTNLPLFSLSYERCIVDNLFDEKSAIGVGGLIGYKQISFRNWGKATDFVLGVRGTFHYALVDKLDTYGGLMLGYDIYKWKWYDNVPGWNNYSTGGSTFSFSFFLGARYYFSNALAAFAELGYGPSIINLGVAFKF